MMAFIGWVVCVIIMMYTSVATFVVLLNCTGTYNIGGAVNKPATKFKAWLFTAVVACGWYLLVINFPFTFGLK